MVSLRRRDDRRRRAGHADADPEADAQADPEADAEADPEADAQADRPAADGPAAGRDAPPSRPRRPGRGRSSSSSRRRRRRPRMPASSRRSSTGSMAGTTPDGTPPPWILAGPTPTPAASPSPAAIAVVAAGRRHRHIRRRDGRPERSGRPPAGPQSTGGEPTAPLAVGPMAAALGSSGSRPICRCCRSRRRWSRRPASRPRPWRSGSSVASAATTSSPAPTRSWPTTPPQGIGVGAGGAAGCRGGREARIRTSPATT